MASLLLIGTAKAFGQSDFPNKYKVGTGSYYIDDELTIKESNLFTDYKSSFGLSSSDEMVRTNHVVHEDGKFRSHYVLYNHGIKVQGFMMNVLGEQGIVKRINGFWVYRTNVDTTNLITVDSAISAAITYMGADEYSWEDTSMSDSSFYAFPKGAKLMIVHKAGTEEDLASNYALCYEVQLTSIAPDTETANVFVNAHTGKGYSIDNALESFTTYNDGQICTWYNDCQQDLTTTKCDFCFRYYLDDNDRNIETRKWSNGWRIFDNDNHWASNDKKKTAATAQWSAERAWDYFANTFYWKGTDNQYNPILVSNNDKPMPYYKIAAYAENLPTKLDVILLAPNNPNCPSGDDGYSSAMLSVLGHEFTHGMIQKGSRLGDLSPHNNPAEADALCEGFADIFGVLIRRQTLGSNSWIEGEYTVNDKRHLDNPHLDSHPAPGKYHESGYWSWVNEPHINGGVIRHWFYLLSEGGTYNGVTVQAIGQDRAAKVAYISFNWWLWSNVSYPKAANQLVYETVADWGGMVQFCNQPKYQSPNSRWL